ncbi:hypothetical protein PMIN01_01647 [Paraphaeosphaeria minitans]|uniref:Uncharacterized protein n=1 Tax=Paraphaeosphaeria minitans TaxID=565426 RepID=A0A9P6KTM3_9PLEO|nr:hypothetical protein PMIN01_01647 [Paraphaeosphaeria minitans]
MMRRGTPSAPISQCGDIVSRFCTGTAISSISLLYGTKPGPRLPALWVLCGSEDMAQLNAVDAGYHASFRSLRRVLSRVERFEQRSHTTAHCMFPSCPGAFPQAAVRSLVTPGQLLGQDISASCLWAQQLTRFLSRFGFTREKIENSYLCYVLLGCFTCGPFSGSSGTVLMNHARMSE